MILNVPSRALTGTRWITARTLVTLLVAVMACPAFAEISPRDSFLAIQRQVESIQPGLVKSTVVLKMSDGSGSGVIISSDGFILTAGHVVEGREGRRVTAVLSDGRSFPATVIASNAQSDLGIAKIADVTGLPTAPLGDSSTLRRGEWVLATGHPLGQHQGRPPVLRIGRILGMRGSRYGREIRSISTDAPIISGDSGGPLFDLNGRVVGINSMISTGERRMISIHVPINLAKAAVARSLKGETPDTWDGPSSAFFSDIRQGQTALQSGDVATALRLAKEASDIDPTSAVARILLARADARSGQPQLALVAINQACERGYNDADTLRKDPDFAPLANQPVLAKLLERLDAFNGIPGERKGDASVLTAGALTNLNQGVVHVQSSGTDVALGTVMSSEGDIITKASELPEGPLTCVLPDGQRISAMRQGIDSLWDVALLKVNAAGLKMLPFSENPVVGEWTFSPDASGGLAAIGMVGVSNMPVHGRGIAPKPTSKAFMGVQMVPVDSAALKEAGVTQGVGVVITRDMAILPAARAGVVNGDIIFEAEGQAIRDPDTLMDLLVKKKPGDSVSLKLARGPERINVTVPLMARPANTPGRNGLPEMLSGDISRMQGPFDHVLHHDSVLAPNAMGGPLLDSDGHCIGLNIARADRTSTYAIQARDLKEVYARLKASR